MSMSLSLISSKLLRSMNFFCNFQFNESWIPAFGTCFSKYELNSSKLQFHILLLKSVIQGSRKYNISQYRDNDNGNRLWINLIPAFSVCFLKTNSIFKNLSLKKTINLIPAFSICLMVARGASPRRVFATGKLNLKYQKNHQYFEISLWIKHQYFEISA